MKQSAEKEKIVLGSDVYFKVDMQPNVDSEFCHERKNATRPVDSSDLKDLKRTLSTPECKINVCSSRSAPFCSRRGVRGFGKWGKGEKGRKRLMEKVEKYRKG